MLPSEILLLTLLVCLFACSDSEPPAAPAPPPHFDLLIQNGTVYDGLGDEPYRADIAIRGDRIAAIGLNLGTADTLINADGLADAPGFINMLSWATESLIEDGRSMSDILQGVTLEVMGEGRSMVPLNDEMKARMLREQEDIKYEIEWTTRPSPNPINTQQACGPFWPTGAGGSGWRTHRCLARALCQGPRLDWSGQPGALIPSRQAPSCRKTCRWQTPRPGRTGPWSRPSRLPLACRPWRRT